MGPCFHFLEELVELILITVVRSLENLVDHLFRVLSNPELDVIEAAFNFFTLMNL